uniref:Uncharacterized protein n=1 Tax=Romanomermis culicivorax TaxID=13658 RepID=A0A915J2R2_ROMCU
MKESWTRFKDTPGQEPDRSVRLGLDDRLALPPTRALLGDKVLGIANKRLALRRLPGLPFAPHKLPVEPRSTFDAPLLWLVLFLPVLLLLFNDEDDNDAELTAGDWSKPIVQENRRLASCTAKKSGRRSPYCGDHVPELVQAIVHFYLISGTDLKANLIKLADIKKEQNPPRNTTRYRALKPQKNIHQDDTLYQRYKENGRPASSIEEREEI